MYSNSFLPIRLGMGHLWVGKFQPTPISAYTIPATGTGAHHPVFTIVLYKTCGTIGTCRFVLSTPPFNLTEATHTSIDVWCAL
jgi:hypothetical protein